MSGSAWADGKLAELAEQLGKMVEHPKSKSTNPGSPGDVSPCTSSVIRRDTKSYQFAAVFAKLLTDMTATATYPPSHVSSFAHFCLAVLFVASCHSCEVCAEESLSGKVLTVAAEKWQPWFVISEGEESEKIAYSGVSHKILQFLESALNFTSKIVRVAIQ